MPVTLSVLASGSRANAILIAEGKTRILIDAGLGIRTLVPAMLAAGTRLDQLSAVLVTHEHTDHVRGLAKLLERSKVPLYASAGTLASVDYWVPARCQTTAMSGQTVEIGSFAVRGIAIPHDAAEPMAYHFEVGGHRITTATDLGEVPPELLEALSHSHSLVLESNHDLEMLRTGSYPEIIKQRIRSERGHLSNEQCAAVLSSIKGNGLRTVVLAHISDENNEPELVRAAAEAALAGTDIALHLTSRSGTGPFVELDAGISTDRSGTLFLPGLG